MLPCDKVGRSGRRSGGKSSDCPDDKIATNRRFWYQSGYSGKGLCFRLTAPIALSGIAATTWRFPVIGKKSLVLTKVYVTHPNKASRRVGIVMFKRLVTHTCTGKRPSFCKKGVTVADVHKVGYCVKCHYNVFASRWTDRSSHRHRKAFVYNCLPRAFNKQGKLKPGFECSGDDMKLAQASISGF